MIIASLAYYPAYDDFDSDIYIPDGSIENRDGSTMFVADVFATFSQEEEAMPIERDSPLTLRWAIGLCFVTVVATGLTGGGIYMALRSDVSDLKSEVSTTRTESVARVDTLRSEMTQGFEKVNLKIEGASKDLQQNVDRSAEKTDSKLDKITESLNYLRQNKASN